MLAWHVTERQQQRRPCDRGARRTRRRRVGVVGAAQQRRRRRWRRHRAQGFARRRTPWGWCRGDRLVSSELAELVTQVRRDGQIRETELLMPRSGVDPSPRDRPRRAAVVGAGARAGRGPHPRTPRRDGAPRLRRQRLPRAQDPGRARSSCSAEAVSDAADDPVAVRRFAGRMLTESDRLTRLVQQIIELSRLQDDDPLDAPAVVDVDEMVAAAVDSRPIDARPSASRSPSAASPGSRCSATRSRSARPWPTWSPTPSTYSGNDSTVTVSAKPDDGHGRALGRRPGHRHPPRGARADLRALLPRRPGPAPLHRRHRPGPVHRQARRGDPRRGDPRVVGRGPRLDLHPHAPPRPPGEPDVP